MAPATTIIETEISGFHELLADLGRWCDATNGLFAKGTDAHGIRQSMENRWRLFTRNWRTISLKDALEDLQLLETLLTGFLERVSDDLPARLRSAREKVCWAQDRLAAESRLRQPDISRIETGHQGPQPSTRQILADFIEQAEAFSGSPKNFRWQKT